MLVGVDGRVRVLDFGLARRGDGDAPGGGTPGYMSPEHFAGEVVDARSDQFSFCVALFEALYGQRPFAGETVPMLMAAVLAGAVQAAAAEARVPARLRRAVRRGLMVRPEDRHAGMVALLAELELSLPRPRGRWAIAAVVSAAVTTGVWWSLARGEDPAAMCAAQADVEVAAVWGAGPRAAIERVFVATELPYARDSFERTARLIDVYVEAWARVRRRTCELGGATVLAAERCLDRRRLGLAAWVDTLRRADATVVEESVAATAELPAAQDCGDPSVLLAADEEADPEIEGLLAQARADGLAGQHARGLAPAMRAQRLAEMRGRPRLASEALLQLGLLHEHTGDGVAAASSFAAAYFTAEAAHHEAARAEAAVHLVHVTGGAPRGREEDALWTKLAEAIAQGRGEGALDLQAMLLQHRSSAALLRGDPEAARADLEAAKAVEARRLGAGHPALAAIDEQLGAVLLLAGRTEEALAVHARAIAGAEAALGPAHPTTARRILARGAVHERRGEFAAALRDYEHALGVWERALGEQPRLIWALTCVGRVLRRIGEPGRAENYYVRALAIAEAAHGRDDPEAAYACVELAGVVAETGRAAEARVLYGRALASLLVDHDPPVLAWPLIEIGEALLTDEPARAAAALEQARRVRIGGDERARADFALARALWSLGEQSRARELAAAAAVGPTEVTARAWLAERL